MAIDKTKINPLALMLAMGNSVKANQPKHAPTTPMASLVAAHKTKKKKNYSMQSAAMARVRDKGKVSGPNLQPTALITPGLKGKI